MSEKKPKLELELNKPVKIEMLQDQPLHRHIEVRRILSLQCPKWKRSRIQLLSR